MIVYFDTSAVIPIVVDEPSSPAAGRLWDEADRVVSSRLVYAEGRADLGRARRMDRLDDDELRTAVDDFESLHRQLDIVEVTDRLVREAGFLAERFELRGYDAVHLASAQPVCDDDTVLAAADGNLLQAAAKLGIAVSNLLHGRRGRRCRVIRAAGRPRAVPRPARRPPVAPLSGRSLRHSHRGWADRVAFVVGAAATAVQTSLEGNPRTARQGGRRGGRTTERSEGVSPRLQPHGPQ